jgi:hypothetical protein
MDSVWVPSRPSASTLQHHQCCFSGFPSMHGHSWTLTTLWHEVWEYLPWLCWKAQHDGPVSPGISFMGCKHTSVNSAPPPQFLPTYIIYTILIYNVGSDLNALISLQPHHVSGVYSICNRNECRKIYGGKARPVCKADNLTTIPCVGGLAYLHHNPSSCKRRENGSSEHRALGYNWAPLFLGI